MQRFYSPGKLLISGEYVVLDGATALALPTKFGQSLEAQKIEEAVIKWKSLDEKGEIWFQTSFPVREILSGSNEAGKTKVEKTLFSILKEAATLNHEMLSAKSGFRITTRTNFPTAWGLGTSSTLIANISKWFFIDAFNLLEKTFGGSGYDVAVALKETPITYELLEKNRSILSTSFDPVFQDRLFFVYLNRKQNSRESINHYNEQKDEKVSTAVEKISSLTHQMITCQDLSEFELLIEIHENIISQLVGLPKVKNKLFADYSGAIKSLGGWGGDFILATGDNEAANYFRRKGYSTIIPYSEMIL